MRNIKLSLQYDGTRYDGWQKQGNTEKTIQGKIEAVLSQILNERIEINGSGRTDSGVHAYNQIANFHTRNDNIDLQELIIKANFNLPNDIVIMSAQIVDESFHSRYNAKGKKYIYRIWNSNFRNPFLERYCFYLNDKLDINAMKAAAEYLIGEHDFSSFTSLKSKKKSKIRTIYAIDFNVNNELIEILFYGNGFLYNMVRIIIGTLLDVGIGKITSKDVKEILNKKGRNLAGCTAPAKGLFLYEVEY
ncbi:MAG: tRNA pseudouridine(38-40) synthase TruA [Deltaproteobacteria bacterium]